MDNIDTHDLPSTWFTAWHTAYEVSDTQKPSAWVRVDTEITDYCPNILARVDNGEACVHDEIDWWEEWGNRLHRARLELEERRVRGTMQGDAPAWDHGARFKDNLTALELATQH